MSFVDQRVIAQRMARRDARLNPRPCPVRGEPVTVVPWESCLELCGPVADICPWRALFMGGVGQSKGRD